MTIKIKEQFYKRMPSCIQRTTSFIPKKMLFGHSYRKWLDFISQSETWSYEKIEEYKIERLRELARIAYYSTKYWHDIFDKHNIKPENFDLDSLQKLPVINAQTIKNHFEDMISGEYTNKGYIVSTGGTGRNPTPIFLSNNAFGAEWAFMYSQWQRIGFTWSQKKATFRGKNLGEKLWQPNPVYNEIILNVFKISSKTAYKIFDHIQRENISFFHGYLSSIYIFAQHLKALNINGKELKLRGILLASENIIPGKRNFLEAFFGCRCYSWYGQSEKVILAGECEYSRDYHIFYQYGLTEVLDNNDNPSKQGRLVGTSFVNPAMPLFRYDTGDWGIVDYSFCDKCKRSYQRLLSVKGRWSQDFVYDIYKNPVPTTAVNIHLADQQDILNLQLNQIKAGEVTLLISFTDNFSNKEETMHSIQKEFQSKLGNNFNVKVSEVQDSDIRRSKIGKVPYLIQNIHDLSTDRNIS